MRSLIKQILEFTVYYLYIIISLILLHHCVYPVEEQVRMRLAQMLDAFNTRDLHQAASIYAEDSKWLPPGVDSLDDRDGMQ